MRRLTCLSYLGLNWSVAASDERLIEEVERALLRVPGGDLGTTFHVNGKLVTTDELAAGMHQVFEGVVSVVQTSPHSITFTPSRVGSVLLKLTTGSLRNG